MTEKHAPPEPARELDPGLDPGAAGAQAVHGMKWTSAARGLTQLLNFGVMIVLARLLSPEDFGQVAMVAVLTGFVALFGELGFGAALVQRKQIGEEHRSSVFWLNVVTGLLLGGIVAGAAPLIADFYREPRLVWLTRVAALSFVVAPLNMVQKNLLSRGLAWKRLAWIEASASAGSSVSALALAFSGFGVWALVLKELIAGVLASVLLWTLSSWRPRLVIDRTALRELVGFSLHLMGFSAINYWARKTDDLLIGRLMGAPALGAYGRAYSLMLLPVQEVAAVLTKVMFPLLSRVQDDRALIKRLYLRTVAMIALLTFPLMAGLFVLAEHAVPFLYGPQWDDAIPILKVFCLIGMLQSIGATVGWIYQSQGRTDWMFRWGLVASVIFVAGIVLGALRGSALDVAWGYAIAALLLVGPSFAIPGRLIGMRAFEVARAVSGVFACALVAGVAAFGVGFLLPRQPHAVHLLVQGTALVATYALLLIGFRVQAFRELTTLVSKQRRAATPTSPAA